MLYSCVCLRERERRRPISGVLRHCVSVCVRFYGERRRRRWMSCAKQNFSFVSKPYDQCCCCCCCSSFSLALSLSCCLIHSFASHQRRRQRRRRPWRFYIILFLSSFQFLSAAAAASQPLNDIIIIIIVFCEKNFLPLPVMFCFWDFKLMRLFNFFCFA